MPSHLRTSIVTALAVALSVGALRLADAHKTDPSGDIVPGGGVSGGGTVEADMTFADDVPLYWGDSNDSVCLYDTVQTPDSLVCGVSSDSSRLLVTTQTLAGVSDLGHAAATYPVLSVTDSTGADVIEIGHDGTDARIETNAGTIRITDEATMSTITMSAQGLPLRWTSGGTRIDDGGIGDGRFRVGQSDQSDGFCQISGRSAMDIFSHDCTSSLDITMPLGSRLCFDGTNCKQWLEFDPSNGWEFYASNDLVARYAPSQIGYFTALLLQQDGESPHLTTMFRNDSTPAADDELFRIRALARDSNGNFQVYGWLYFDIRDPSTPNEDGRWRFQLTDNGSVVDYMYIDAKDGQEGIYAIGGPYVHNLQEGSSVSEPAVCSATTIGMTQVIDDTNDGLGTEICYCGMTDDTTYDWLSIHTNAACSFF